MAPTRLSKDDISDALVAVRTALGSQGRLAAILGVSRRTLERYIYGGQIPPLAKRGRIVARLSGHVDPTLLSKLAATLEVTVQAPAAAAGIAVDVGVPLELSVMLSAERNGVSPAAARQIALDVLQRVTELRLDAPTARNVLAATIAMRAASTVPA